MKRSTINFTWHQDRRATWMGFLLLIFATVVALWVAWQDIELQRDLETRLVEQQGLQRVPESPQAELSPEEKERQHTELKMAQGVIERLDTPWGVLFAAIDSAFDDQVTLLNVEPVPERREVQLIAEAKDLSAMQAYVRQIRGSPVFRDAYLASHQINQQDPLRPVRFIIHARWVVPPESSATKANATNETSAAEVPPAPESPVVPSPIVASEGGGTIPPGSGAPAVPDVGAPVRKVGA